MCWVEALRKEKRYTYTDYRTWDDDERWELIDGVPYAMPPAPLRIHQEILGGLFSQLHNFLRGKHCKVFVSPFDVRLNADTEDDIVVQPDIVVVCDDSKLDDKSCVGAPDMAIEIISPSTSAYDRVLKFNKYLQAGVREYWIVDPASKTVSANVLKDGKYMASAYLDTDTAPVHVLNGCVINFADVFGA